MLVADLLVQLIGEDGGVLAVEVSLERMADRLVQQDAGASRTHHDGHLASLGLDCLEEDGGLIHGLLRQLVDEGVGQELSAHAESPGRVGVLDASLLLHDADGPEGDHRSVVVIHLSLRVAEEDVRGGVAQGGLHLHHPLILGEDLVVQLLQVGHLVIDGHLVPGGLHVVEVEIRFQFTQVDRSSGRVSIGDACRCACRLQHLLKGDVLHIGISGLIAGEHTHAHAEVDVRRGPVHGTILQTHVVAVGVLEIEIGVVASLFQRCRQHFPQIAFAHLEIIHGESHACGFCRWPCLASLQKRGSG